MNSAVYTYISHNLKLKKQEDLSFPYSDLGFLYGYGLFESICVQNGRAVMLREHLTRIRRSGIMLEINNQWGQDQISQAVVDLIEKNKVQKAVLNIYLSAGERSGLLVKEKKPQPMLLMVLRPYDEEKLNHDVNLDLRQESFQRGPLDGLKTMAWMKNWLELRFCEEDCDDVLLYDSDGRILETALANVFFIKGNRLFTPKHNTILSGVTRQVILNHQDHFNCEVIMEIIEKETLALFDEVFLCNAIRGIINVSSLKTFPSLKSGPKTQEIKKLYATLLNKLD